VGSNPTRSISFTVVNYGIGMSLFWISVGQILQQRDIVVALHHLEISKELKEDILICFS
jgi:hypothetical protein